MDREKRHSKEAEEELDKKIALIREKNQIIVERTKEIEADRAQSTDGQPKKSPKSSSDKPSIPPKSSPTNGGGGRAKREQWDREWDKGKQPVDKWRENVPSIDVAGRLAGRGGARGGQQHQQKPRQQEQKGSRLEGRITGVTVDGGATRGGAASSNRGRSGIRGGRGGQQRNQHSRSVEKVGGDLKISISSIESGDKKRGPRQRNQPKLKKDNQGSQASTTGEQDEIREKKRSTRPRRENDKYVVKTIVGRLVNRVVQMEKRAKNRAEKEDEGTPEEENVAPEEPENEKLEKIKKENDELKQVEKPEEPIKELPEAVLPEKDNISEQSATPDANQNIIVLEKEKVATIQMSTA